MSVLAGLLVNPMSLGAADRAGPTWRQESWPVRVIVVAVVAVLSLGATWSVRALVAPAGQTSTRDALVDQVGQSQERVDAQATAVATLQAQVDGLEAAGSALLPPEEQERSTRLGIATGTVAVTGPGLRVTLEDAPDAGSGRNDEGRVQDSDLQAVVDALWAAGAEAVAVNGNRLGSASAIRAAGQAVLVDLAPVTSPYTVEAVGDPDALRSGLEDSDARSLLVALERRYGITSDTQEVDGLHLPATVLTKPQHAERVS